MKSLRICLLAFLALIAGSSHDAVARHARGGVSPPSGGGGSSPLNVQVILQGQNQAVATSSGACVAVGKGGGALLEPNWNEVGWQDTSGGTATQFNIYRAVNGGSYPALGSPTYTVSASTAASNFTTYSGQYPTQVAKYGTYLGGGSNGQGPAPGIDHTYIDTSATATIGNSAAAGVDFVGNVTLNGTTSITVNSVNGGVAASGSLVGGSGYTDGSYTIVNSNAYSCVSCASSGNSAKGTITISGGTVTSATISTTAQGAAYQVGDTLGCTSTCASTLGIGAGSGFHFTVTSIMLPTEGVGDTAGHIPLGAYIVSQTSGTTGGPGVYVISQATTGGSVTESFGAVKWGNQGYTYKVSAVVGGVESAMSTDAILPFMAGGHLVMSNGTFDSCIGTNQTGISPASPLGYSAAVGFWPIDPGGSGPGSSCGNYPAYMNAFTGNSAVNYNGNTTGYKYLVISLMPNTSGNTAPSTNAEICGDAGLSQLSGTTLASYGPSTMTANVWNTYKIPVSVVFADVVSGVMQTGMYKITWGWNPGTPTAGTFAYVEYYWSVN